MIRSATKAKKKSIPSAMIIIKSMNNVAYCN